MRPSSLILDLASCQPSRTSRLVIVCSRHPNGDCTAFAVSALADAAVMGNEMGPEPLIESTNASVGIVLRTANEPGATRLRSACPILSIAGFVATTLVYRYSGGSATTLKLPGLVDTPVRERMGVQVASKRRKRRQFTPEYKAEIVELVRTSGKTVGQIARELELTETAVRAWVKAAEVDDGNAQVEQSANLQAELRAAKRRIKELEMEKAILKKAAALFAREDS